MPLDSTLSGHRSNIRLLATACEIAYRDEPEAIARFRAELGLEARLIAVDNTQAYVAADRGSVVVAFRGSQKPDSLDGFKDWLLTNANNLLVIPEGRIGTDFAAAGVGARFHRGFMEALAEIWDPLLAAVQTELDTAERPLWVTGHSLGGALALLAAWRFERQLVPVHEVVTFGAPMVGNVAAAEALERAFGGRVHRCVDVEDPVPLLPKVSLLANAYCHCPQEIQLKGPNPRSLAEVLSALSGGAVDGLMSASLADEVWGVMKSGFAAHPIRSYRGRLEV